MTPQQSAVMEGEFLLNLFLGMISSLMSTCTCTNIYVIQFHILKYVHVYTKYMYEGCIFAQQNRRLIIFAHAVFQSRPESTGSAVEAATPSEEAETSEERKNGTSQIQRASLCLPAGMTLSSVHGLGSTADSNGGRVFLMSLGRTGPRSVYLCTQLALSFHLLHLLPAQHQSVPMSSAGWALKQQPRPSVS